MTQTKDYLEQKDKLPPLCSEDRVIEVKETILGKLFKAELMFLSTVTPSGWPIVDCVHFTTVEGKDKKPVFYVFTQKNSRKIENIENDDRVGVSICFAKSYEDRDQTWAFQFMGKAEMVSDENELKIAVDASRKKTGYEFTSHLDLESQPCIKIEPTYGMWMNRKENPPACTIDYGM